jgi:hypothetical protein
MAAPILGSLLGRGATRDAEGSEFETIGADAAAAAAALLASQDAQTNELSDEARNLADDAMQAFQTNARKIRAEEQSAERLTEEVFCFFVRVVCLSFCRFVCRFLCHFLCRFVCCVFVFCFFFSFFVLFCCLFVCLFGCFWSL